MAYIFSRSTYFFGVDFDVIILFTSVFVQLLSTIFLLKFKSQTVFLQHICDRFILGIVILFLSVKCWVTVYLYYANGIIFYKSNSRSMPTVCFGGEGKERENSILVSKQTCKGTRIRYARTFTLCIILNLTSRISY